MYLPVLLCDFYKILHREQYPDKTEFIGANWTPRGNKYHPTTNKVVVFGFQPLIKEFFIDVFNKFFFQRDKEEVVAEYSRFVKYTMSIENPHTKHIEDLWDLQYLPLKIDILPEGTLCPIRVPMASIENTLPEFFWLTNKIESLLSCEVWLSQTTATIAWEYRQLLDEWCEKTGGDPEFVSIQGHDFSMRGMEGVYAAASGGGGHLLSFIGTDTPVAVLAMEKYYNANIETELVGGSIPATEHSVMCAGGETNEFEMFKRLITEVYPSGPISIVSDTWDLWAVLTDIMPRLKKEIMARDGKVVVRPDSGDPVDIICGNILDMRPDGFAWTKVKEGGYVTRDGKYYKAILNDTIMSWEEIDVAPPEAKGVIQLLWEEFGGKINEAGYKELDSHVGAIYGDSITLERANLICQRLAQNGFASTNIVFGIGSFTYQYNTRDTFGFAMKTTFGQVDGEKHLLFKDPVTDDGLKKSLKGKFRVYRNDEGEIVCEDGLYDNPDPKDTLLEPVFLNGMLLRDHTLAEIRERLANQ